VVDQVVSGATQTVRIISKLSETGVAGTADQSAERFTSMVVVDVQPFPFTNFSCLTFTDLAPFSALHGAKDGFHLSIEPEYPNAVTKKLRRVFFRVGAFPRTLLGQSFGLLFGRAHNALQVGAGFRSLAFTAPGSRLRSRACANAKSSDRQPPFAGTTGACFTDPEATLLAEFRNNTLQLTAAAGTPVVADPVPRTFQTPLCDALGSESTLEALLRRRQFASSAVRALVVEFPVSIRVQPEPTAVRSSAPSKRFDRRSRGGSRVGHFSFDGYVLVCIRTSKELSQ
jgi:hypothetical protein